MKHQWNYVVTSTTVKDKHVRTSFNYMHNIRGHPLDRMCASCGECTARVTVTFEWFSKFISGMTSPGAESCCQRCHTDVPRPATLTPPPAFTENVTAITVTFTRMIHTHFAIMKLFFGKVSVIFTFANVEQDAVHQRCKIPCLHFRAHRLLPATEHSPRKVWLKHKNLLFVSVLSNGLCNALYAKLEGRRLLGRPRHR